MKMLFIHCNIKTNNIPHFVTGIGSISAVLKQAGHETALLFVQEELDKDALVQRIREEAPDLIGFSTVTNQMMFVRQYTRWIREEFALPIIHGGVHVTVAPEESLEYPEIDMICMGEGEYSVLELLERLADGNSITDIPNLWLKQSDGTVVRNGLRPLIRDLDSLPFPDRELFDSKKLLANDPLQASQVMTGRGCPYTCTYCVNHALQKLFKNLGPYVRRRSPENVIAEIQKMQQDYEIRQVFIYDDTFTLNHQWVRKFCELYPRKVGIPFAVQIRVETVNEKLLRLLKDTGCVLIYMGVESGSARVREEVMDRKMSNQSIVEVFRLIRSLGMKSYAYNMIGMPTETKEEIEESMELIRLVKPDRSQVTVFYPFPGTKLHELCKKEGYLKDNEGTNVFSNQGMLDLPTLSQEVIAEYAKQFNELLFRIEVGKKSTGYYDFLEKSSTAEIKTEKDYVAFKNAQINQDERMVIFAHPESEVKYLVNIKKSSVLSFGIGIAPQAWDTEAAAGVLFRIVIGENEQERIVYSRYLDPTKHKGERKWHDTEISLGPSLEGETVIRFITTTRGRPNYYAWANWSRPVLYSSEEC
jgi:radical SAM superfamily enzyme YgiQ (UPF0313 family)